MPSRQLRLGVSACFFHADPKRAIFKGKTLLYMEQSIANWVMSGGAVPVLVPPATPGVPLADLLDGVDGLVLQGGSDMSPTHYGEEPRRPEWEGDYVRDVYEIELVKTCMRLDKPVFGVCRGLQVINVALGGSLFQDIQTMHPKQEVHRNWDVYDQLFHDVSIRAEGWLSRVYAGAAHGRVNSVHHQGIKTLGRGLVAEAVSRRDELVEAVRYHDGERAPFGGAQNTPFVYGVQWHPEFLNGEDEQLLNPKRLIRAFVEEVRSRKQTIG